jgi:hypothetical protein
MSEQLMLIDFVHASANFAVGHTDPSVQLKYRADAAEGAPVTLHGCKRSSETNTKMALLTWKKSGENSRPAVAPKGPTDQTAPGSRNPT